MDEAAEYRKWWVGVQVRVENMNRMHARLKQVNSFLEGTRMVKVAQKDAQALFTALGHAKVENWSDQRLQDKVEGLKDFAEEEGDELPKLKGTSKKTFDKIIAAIDDEEEIDVVPTETDEDEDDDDEELDEDVQDSEDDEDLDDDEDEEPAGEDDDEEPDEEDEDEDDEAPAPSRKVEAREEFIGIRELVAICTRLAVAVEALVPAAAGKADRPSRNGSAGKSSMQDVVTAIRNVFASATSADKALTPDDVAKKLAENLTGWRPSGLKKRIIAQLERRMPKDGIVVKKAKGGKFWVKK